MKHSVFSGLKVFAANSHPALAEEISNIMGKPLGKLEVKKFSDGEVCVNLGETVRGVDCFVTQSTCAPGNENLMELLITSDAIKRASAPSSLTTATLVRIVRQSREIRSQQNW